MDDDADTGESLQLAGEHLRQNDTIEVQIAILYCKPLSVITPYYYEKQTRRWVVFPWDAKENMRKIIEKSREKLVVNVNVAKLVKEGLPKQLVEEVLKEAVEAGKC